MKTSLKLLAIAVVTGLPCVAFAETFGSRVPSTFGAENIIGLFAIVSIGLVAVSDYSRRARTRAFASSYRKATTETHRLAA